MSTFSFSSFLGKIKKDKIGRYKKILSSVNKISLQSLSDHQLKAKTAELKAMLEKGATLKDLLPEAFAIVREASARTLNMRHFDVQMLGGMALVDGSIAEMKTGEGKTLVATLPSYLYGLTGKGVHVVTPNDYLAKRDAQWMGKVHQFLGLTVGCVQSGMGNSERREAYNCDVVYATNNELGFDYLRDNMVFTKEEMVQRGHFYALVDEIDAILIDEARTPLVISGPSDDTGEVYKELLPVVDQLKSDDIKVDEESRSVVLSEKGEETMENVLLKAGLIQGNNLYDSENVGIVHHVTQTLRAKYLFKRDKDYIVKAGSIVIVDEFTGRLMEGRRYSDGLHQALEAKEGVEIKQENQTFASITFQNYFRLYQTLSGMTGTASTEAREFQDIYGLKVISIPTHKHVTRHDADDEVYGTKEEKLGAIVAAVKEAHQKGQPVLLGTTSIEQSELFSGIIKKEGIEHEVLNARQHAKEAEIIAQAGRLGAVTIATNMAGRGTDIQLGGNWEMLQNQGKNVTQDEITKEKEDVLKAGGLFVLGTERHESRRIDNQLRGRSGRQGDPGKSKFFLSLEDDLMRIFAPDKVGTILKKLGMSKGEALVHPWITKALENAQKKIEARNYNMRKTVLRYDDLMNEQRRIIYGQRLSIMGGQDLDTDRVITSSVEKLAAIHMPEGAYREQWGLEDLKVEFERLFRMEMPVIEEKHGVEEIRSNLLQAAKKKAGERRKELGQDAAQVIKSIMLHVLDVSWREHLNRLGSLRQSISLRAYGQKDPLQEYKKEGFTLFHHMLSEIERRTVMLLFAEIKQEPQKPVSRNALCPCGSGMRFKHCHGKIT